VRLYAPPKEARAASARRHPVPAGGISADQAATLMQQMAREDAALTLT